MLVFFGQSLVVFGCVVVDIGLGFCHGEPGPVRRPMTPQSSRYTPSPRPTYDRPTLVTRAGVRRHIWGDREAGLVADWLYASTDKLHVLLFGLAAGKWFRHSPAYRTVFGADEVFYVLSGSMVASNPETGEVVEASAGDCMFFRRNTWHHVYAAADEPLRVLEFFAPPPSTGASGAYAATRPYLDVATYRRDELIGDLWRSAPEPTLRIIRRSDLSLRMEGELLVGMVASTEHLTIALVDVDPGAQGTPTTHGGDAMLFGLDGELMVRTFWKDESVTFEVAAHDAVFVPQGAEYEVLSFANRARAVLGVAPQYLP